jgi:hypothetical protein
MDIPCFCEHFLGFMKQICISFRQDVEHILLFMLESFMEELLVMLDYRFSIG